MELFVGLSGNSMEFLSLFLRDGVLGSLGSTIPKKKPDPSGWFQAFIPTSRSWLTLHPQ
jgi:hypothetical protein